MNILILEDDIPLCRGIELALKDGGRAFTLCHDVFSARQTLKDSVFDLLIVDINLPDGSGLDFCREIRNSFAAPILILTANDTEIDMVAGLEAGGDDYVAKPFSLAVLRARINALLRRNSNAYASKIMIDGFFFDFEAMQFTKRSLPVELSKTEQRLLRLLLSNRGHTIPREKLLEHIWPDGSEYVDENALSVAIRRLRAKLEDDPSNPQYIKTVYGLGYTWAVSK